MIMTGNVVALINDTVVILEEELDGDAFQISAY